jgi:hypothetical protein
MLLLAGVPVHGSPSAWATRTPPSRSASTPTWSASTPPGWPRTSPRRCSQGRPCGWFATTLRHPRMGRARAPGRGRVSKSVSNRPRTQQEPRPCGAARGSDLLVSVSTQSAPEGIRTPNLLIRSQMLYPLSYGRRCDRNDRVATSHENTRADAWREIASPPLPPQALPAAAHANGKPQVAASARLPGHGTRQGHGAAQGSAVPWTGRRAHPGSGMTVFNEFRRFLARICKKPSVDWSL